ncbi:hypothetical protein ACXZ65_37935 [Streptomyces aculeolatus]
MTAVDAAAAVDDGELIGRCYTRARTFPVVIGKLPGGGRLWGGPYTRVQLGVFIGGFVVLLLTRDAWGHFGLVNYVVLLGVPLVSALVVQRIHVDGRSPLAVAGSLLGLSCSPRSGRLGGRPLKSLGRPRPLAGACTLRQQPLDDGDLPAADPAPAEPASSAAAARPVRRRVVPPAAAVPRPQAAPAVPPPAAAGGPRVLSGAELLLARGRSGREG